MCPHARRLAPHARRLAPHARRLALALSLTAASAWAGEGVPEAVDAARIPSYKKITPELAAAGQPSPEALGELKALGFGTVVNLRTAAEEGVAAEPAAVLGQGLRYVSVPLTADSFSVADVEAVEAVLRDPASGPVLLHCHSSNRVGGVWAAIQARRGVPLEEALAAGREAGLRSPAMVAAVRRVLGLPPAPPLSPVSPAAPAPVKP